MVEKESGDKSPHSKVIECGDLRVVFYWLGDRFGHRIERRADGQWCAIVESLEGSPDAEWPLSPVLQSLQIEGRKDGRVALLVGTAGKSHWSASIEAEPARRRLVFDFACRVCDSPQWLGSQYRALANDSRRIDIGALQNDSIVERPSRGKANEWWIRPLELPPQWPSTIRWRYSIGSMD